MRKVVPQVSAHSWENTKLQLERHQRLLAGLQCGSIQIRNGCLESAQCLGSTSISVEQANHGAGTLTSQQGSAPAEQQAGAGGVPVPLAAQSLMERADERRARGLQELSWLLNDAGALTEPSQAGQLSHQALWRYC